MYTKGLERHLLLDTKCHFDVKFISKTTRLFEMKIVLHSFLGKHLKNKRKIRLYLRFSTVLFLTQYPNVILVETLCAIAHMAQRRLGTMKKASTSFCKASAN